MANIQEIVFLVVLLCNFFLGSSTTLPSVSIGGAVAEVEAESQLFYSRFSACRRGREFAVVVHEGKRQEGSVYYRRVRVDGRVKHYFCAPCTVCGDYGLSTTSPCAERTNSKCSTDCLEPGCVFDKATSSCKLGSDDVSNATMSSLLCSSRRMLLTTRMDSRRPQPVEGGQIIGDSDRDVEMETTEATVAVTTETSDEKPNEVVKGRRVQVSEEPRITPSYVFSWTASDAVFVGAGIVIAVILANVGAILYIQYYRRTQTKRSERERSKTTSSLEAFYAALARARTDSNVTNNSSEIAAV